MSDLIQGFQLDQIGMRGRMVRMDAVLDQIITQHDYPEWVGFQLAEALLLNAAMAASLKLQGKLSLQIQSEGAIKFMSTDFYAAKEADAPTMRGYVRFDEVRLAEGEPLYKNGIFGILLDQGDGTKPYQGITKLEDRLVDSAVSYFAQSEQIPTVFHIDVVRDALKNKWHGGLIMVQKLAEEGGHAQNKVMGTMEDVEAILHTITSDEMLTGEISSEELLYRLFHEFSPTANEAQPIKFGCQCSAEKVEQSLSIYSQKDLEHMTNEDGKITADCQFCGAHYELDPKKLGFESI